MGDMTYDLIKQIKFDINDFKDELTFYAEQNNFKITRNDISFFTFLAKKIIFLKFLYENSQDNKVKFFLKVLISDYYYLITSLIEEEYRYVYLNERSIIENSTRLMFKKPLGEEIVTLNLLSRLKTDFSTIFNDDNFSLIKSEYVTSCKFIHGNDVLEQSLKYVFREYTGVKWDIAKRNQYYERMQKLIKIYEKGIVQEYKELVDGSFFRKKTLLEFLTNKEIVDYLF